MQDLHRTLTAKALNPNRKPYMAERFLLREISRRCYLSGNKVTPIYAILHNQQFYSTISSSENTTTEQRKSNQLLSLPPFSYQLEGSVIGKKLTGSSETKENAITALKWILRCCPHLPRCLVQKLFRLRQIRKGGSDIEASEHRGRRIGAKEVMGIGDRIFLPKSLGEECSSKVAVEEKILEDDNEDLQFIRSLELYKDSAIIVINKPPGMPVQGGIGIKRSLDELAVKYLKYDHTEYPRLVHRLDRDSSGILVMGRSQFSATILHSVFREQTSEASAKDFRESKGRILEKKYWALVVGCPRRMEGLISMPLVKVVVDNGKSERITVVEKGRETLSSQHAVTGYRVIASSHNYTWLELSPLTGRKHQLRVHCAEVLGTPIVGDYKYGWQAHKKLGHLVGSISNLKPDRKMSKIVNQELENGDISDKLFRLHLHCKEMVLPNISQALEFGNTISNMDVARMDSIQIDAPLPAHMQRSWNLLK